MCNSGMKIGCIKLTELKEMKRKTLKIFSLFFYTTFF